MKPTKTCILVADGARARVYLNDGPGHGISELKQYAREIDLKASRDIDADRPGRTFDSGGQGRHAKEKPTDSQRHAKDEFARELAETINAAITAGEFDRLVLVAPPATLGDLRQHLSKQSAGKIHGEIAKNLTQAGDEEILAQLGSVLAV
ncbi:MAG TPA: host attachment protein [Rhizobiales bacterium]|nr:protein required for attachment to host cells [bacterium BMS3Bbin10]HDO52729.1 host attachment protein [Hyphomicrobiales bacterium]